jgi:hypothetical protein
MVGMLDIVDMVDEGSIAKARNGCFSKIAVLAGLRPGV